MIIMVHDELLEVMHTICSASCCVYTALHNQWACVVQATRNNKSSAAQPLFIPALNSVIVHNTSGVGFVTTQIQPLSAM
jgi:hypothetical protein